MNLMMKAGLYVAALVALTTGCGSDPGTGTKTLYVEAQLASDGSSSGTNALITIRQGSSSGSIVSDATIVLTGDEGGRPAINAALSFLGIYTASGFAWEPGWRLHVTRGTDELEAYLVVPGLTTITNPTTGQVYDHTTNAPLVVRWRDDLGHAADQVTVDANRGDYDAQLRAGDAFERDIPASAWSQSYSDERVTVTRENLLNLAGGVAGSVLKARTTTNVSFAVQ
jgi:hypothetical protein